MVYGTIADVKQRVGVTTATHDTQITDNLTDANSYVDTELTPFVTVPLSVPPQIVIEAENSIAAGMFIEERWGATRGSAKKSELRIRGEEKLQGYIDATYKPGKVARSTSGFAVMSSSDSWEA
jgi:hypothetical protein